MKLDPAWLRANSRGIDPAVLERLISNSSPEYIYGVTFEPAIIKGGTIWLPILGWRPSSLNEIMSGVKIGIRLKKRDRVVIAEAVVSAGLEPATFRRRISMQIRVPKGQRRWDGDALWKSTLDACVQAKLLVNDSPVWCEVGRVDYAPERGSLKTTLIIEDLCGPSTS